MLSGMSFFVFPLYKILCSGIQKKHHDKMAHPIFGGGKELCINLRKSEKEKRYINNPSE